MGAYPVVMAAHWLEPVVAAATTDAAGFERKVRRVNLDVVRGREVPLGVVTNGRRVGGRGTLANVRKTIKNIVKRGLPRPGRKRADSFRGKRLSDAGLRPGKSCRSDASGGSDDGVEQARDTGR